MHTPAFAAVNLTCVRQSTCLFQNLHFEVLPGTVFWIEGANGSGKTSLLNILAGLHKPYEGEVIWHKQNIFDDLPSFYEQSHYIGHKNGIKLALTVEENIQLFSFLQKTKLKDYNNLLDTLQLTVHLNTKAAYLSAGQKRKLTLAKLLLFPKKIWFLDEPLTALDLETQTLFVNLLSNHLKQDGLAIISSHQTLVNPRFPIQSLKLASL